MSVPNQRIADVFDALANLLAIEGANPFRVRAYRGAARTVRGYGRSVADLLDQREDLTRLPGIGRDLAGKIETIVRTGRLPLLEEVKSRTPAALGELMKLEGLGPKRVRTLHKMLKIRDLSDLENAAKQGKIRRLPGFGSNMERLIRKRSERLDTGPQPTKLFEARNIARPLVRYLNNVSGVKKLSIAGSYRRRKETVGDLDVLVTASRNSRVMERFVAYDDVEEVVSRGKTRSTVRLRSGMQVDLRVVPQVSYGAALYYFTGSKAHSIAVRKIAVRKRLKLNEYGVFRGENRVAGKTEKEVFDSVGLSYIAPELRENRGEIEVARRGKLPRLVSLEDVRGDLHCHTSATDGRASMSDMVEAARKHGYEYISINDHSRHLAVAHGLDKRRLLAQVRKIDKLNERLRAALHKRSACAGFR